MGESSLTEGEILTITELAYNVAKNYHKDQKYGGDKDYVDYHLAQVVNIVTSFTDDSTTQVIAWLHDILEDTYISKETIANKFGNYVAEQVQTLTRPQGHKDYAEKQYQLNLKSCTKDVAMVKIADIIANLSNIGTKRGDTKEYAKTKLEELKICMDRLK